MAKNTGKSKTEIAFDSIKAMAGDVADGIAELVADRAQATTDYNFKISQLNEQISELNEIYKLAHNGKSHPDAVSTGKGKAASSGGTRSRMSTDEKDRLVKKLGEILPSSGDGLSKTDILTKLAIEATQYPTVMKAGAKLYKVKGEKAKARYFAK